jgi:ankyrin repeat protein
MQHRQHVSLLARLVCDWRLTSPVLRPLLDSLKRVGIRAASQVMGAGVALLLHGCCHASSGGLSEAATGYVGIAPASRGNEETALHQAARFNRYPDCESLIASGAELNAKNRLGQTPLEVATQSRAKEVAELLYRHGAKLDVLSASFLGLEAEVRRLLTAEPALARMADRYGTTPLHLAAECGLLSITRLLIEAGAYPNATNVSGRTAVHLAAQNCHEPIIRTLAPSGADLNLQDNKGLTPLHLAVLGGCRAVMNALVELHAKLDVEDLNGATPAHCAAIKGHKELLSLLISRGASNSIFIASTLGDLRGVQSFLDADHSLLESTKGGWTPLHWAASSGQPEVVRLLLERGAEPNAPDLLLGQTPLHWAARACHTNVIALLVMERNVHLNSKDRRGSTPLHVAVDHNCAGAVSLLLAGGARTDTKDADGKSPFDYAEQSSDPDIQRLLREARSSK